MFHDQLPVRYKLHSRVRNVAVPPSAQHTNFSKDGRRCRPGASQVLSIGTYCTSQLQLGIGGIFDTRKGNSELRGALPQISLAPSAAPRGTGLVHACVPAARSPMRMRPCGRCPPPRGSPASRHLRPARRARARAGRAANCADTDADPPGEIPQTPKKNYGTAVPRYRCILQCSTD
jgi:hypothetical protein